MKKLDKSGKVNWIDISESHDELSTLGIIYEDAMKSIHVYDTNKSELASGVDGFLLLWTQLPYYRQLAKTLNRSPLLKKGLSKAYTYFAKYRLKLKKQSS